MKPAVITALVAALMAGGVWYRHHVYEIGYMAGQAAQRAVYDKALATANNAAQARQNELQIEADEANMNRATENEKHKTDLEAARAAVRAGRERLSIAGTCSSRAAGGAQASPATGPSQAERTDLLPGTADDFIRIAGDVAQGVRDYNSLLARYNAVCQ